jgi:hypothetical protein
VIQLLWESVIFLDVISTRALFREDLVNYLVNFKVVKVVVSDHSIALHHVSHYEFLILVRVILALDLFFFLNTSEDLARMCLKGDGFASIYVFHHVKRIIPHDHFCNKSVGSNLLFTILKQIQAKTWDRDFPSLSAYRPVFSE